MLLSGCATVHYPSHINTSMISYEGETQVGGSINFSSVTAQATHALSENFRLASSFNSFGAGPPL